MLQQTENPFLFWLLRKFIGDLKSKILCRLFVGGRPHGNDRKDIGLFVHLYDLIRDIGRRGKVVQVKITLL